MTHSVPLKRLISGSRPITYGIVQAGVDTPGGVPYIRPTDMTPRDGVRDEESLLRTTPEIAAAYLRSTILAGDIVLSIGPSYGKVMVVPKSLSGANLTQGTARLASGPKSDARFLYWALQTSQARDFWDLSVAGATFRALNLEPLSRTPIPLWPLNVQRRIADFLDDQVTLLDVAIRLRKQQIERLSDRRKGVIAQTVTCGLNSTVQFTESGIPWIGRIPEHWSVRPCRAMVTERNERNHDGEGKNYLSLMANVGVILYADKGDVGNKKPDDLSKCKMVRLGDMVINSMNYQIGSFGLSSYIGVCSPVYIVLTSRAAVDRHYVARLFEVREFQRLAQSFGNGILEHRRSISWDSLKNLPMPVPPIAEQEQIADYLTEQASVTDELVNQMTYVVDLLTKRKQSLITAAVMGQFDVTTARSVA